MTETPPQHLLHQLQHLQPHSILVAASQVPEVVRSWADDHKVELTTIGAQQHDWHKLRRYEFTIVTDYLEHLHKTEAMQKLALLRNLHSQRIWVLVRKEGPLSFGDFIGLGFHRYAEFEGDEDRPASVCYGYDLTSYNQVRSWNNPRYWANPENWNKYRW